MAPRWWGYAAAAAAAIAGSVLLARCWREPPPDVRAIAERIERLFPQSRGLALDALHDAGTGLLAARVEAARGWIADRGPARLDAALAWAERPFGVRVRRLVAGAVVLLATSVVFEPGAAGRVVAAFSTPTALWSEALGAWRIEPGDARVPYGGTIDGRASFRGPAARGRVVLEWRETGGPWRAETLAAGSPVTWRWEHVTSDRSYRLRLGSFVSRAHRVEVGPPLTLGRVEGRRPGGAWEPLSGRVVRAEEPLEIRGWASAPLAAAAVVPAGGGQGAPFVGEGTPLPVEGERLEGTVRLSAGGWRVALRAADGATLAAAEFRAVRSGEAYVLVLRPSEDPVRLAATHAWIEARAGAPDGIRAIGWETAGRSGSAAATRPSGGRHGTLGDAGGARDTVMAAVAPVAEGLGPGDTVRYRVVAFPMAGPPVASGWRTAVVADAAELRAEAGAARAEAVEGVERAADEARAAAERSADAAMEADERLRRAADSLASALDRTLADPSLAPEARERLEAYRELLQGLAQAEMARARVPGPVPPDPAAAARARAELMSEIAAAIRRAEDLAARAAAADSLGRLADAERALAADTRDLGGDRIPAEVGDRQEAVARAARAAAERLGADPAARIERALQEAAREIAEGEPAAAAEAQEDAAATMDSAADQARAEAAADAERAAARRAAVDRAAGETLFLAERQRAVSERLAMAAVGPEERADRLARQRVVVQGLDRTLATLVEGMGGLPAAAELARLLAEAVYATRRAEGVLAGRPAAVGPAGERLARAAAGEAAGSLALLARAFLLPPGSFRMSGAQGSSAESGSLSRQLDAMASAQRSIADAVARADDPAGGSPEAAAAERELGQELGGLAAGLEAQGIDARAVGALLEAVESAARRLERGLPGARAETELRSLARRFADLGRIVQRAEGERKAEPARGFVPTQPPPLPPRATARRLDPDAALAPWAASLPRPALAPARAYLERLADEGVRAPGGP